MRTFLFTVIFFALFSVFYPDSWAASLISSSPIARMGSQDLSWNQSRRLGFERCWVIVRAIEGEAFCISHSLWKSLLSRKSEAMDFQVYWQALRSPHFTPKWEAIQIRENPSRTLGIGVRFWLKVEDVREKFSERLRGVQGDQDEFGVWRKLLLNESTPGSLHGFLRRLGFVHLVSAAGIHWYAVSGWFERGVLLLCRSIHVPVIPGLVISRLLSLLSWGFLWLLGGLRPGMLRPWIVILLRRGSQSLGFRFGFFAPLLISLSLDLVLEGFSLLQGHSFAPGRIHYALSVGGGLIALEQVRSKNILIQHSALALGSWIPSALFDALESGWIVTATPLLSLITIPLWVGLLYPWVIVGLVFDSRLACVLVQLSDRCLSTLSDLSAHYLPPVFLGLWGLLPALLFAFVIPPRPGVPSKKFVLSVPFFSLFALLFRVLLWNGGFSLKGEALLASQVIQLDVGQGDSALIRWKEGFIQKQALIDTGLKGARSPESWMDLLTRENGFSMDSLVLTHLDQDHVGALPTLRALTVFQSEKFPFFVERIQSRSGRHTGNEFMNAVAVPLQSGELYVNAGDSDQSQEILFLEKLKAHFGTFKRRSVILKLSHHGSRFSSSEAYLSELNPDRVWISSGRKNTYGHPTFEALSRVLKCTHARVERTDTLGNLKAGN